ncbi:MAG: hypothetical protein EOQ98_30390 [Mesorhizobium sp.]|uniref:hypothetical protein n=1 Tax=Mesorhizobium sp. TaxID=1871066 RepID=UPI000FE9AD2C|nr:hypothetical protein [Mesorhizobium sp.]RWO94576.1 MAG: hypothetical protein EOQ98_30390 [Mesorhizobium sp.]RWP72384.1 MAG: hypothetical protein EOR09_21305 [Mesorhizobium sp.]TIM51237.1 MAG: hypothetical protein E5Y69_06650 [Mesorhizobium sp.]
MSKLDDHRRAIADILAYLASHGLAGTVLGPDHIASADSPKMRGDDFVDIVRWLENEGVIRVPGRPSLANGWFPKAQLTAVGLQILGLESPTSKGQSIETTLAEPASPETRTKIGEFIGSVLGGFFNSQK